MQFAGFWRRVLAYIVDIIPVTAAVTAVFYVFFGFDEVLARYLQQGPRNVQARAEFLEHRNVIRKASLLAYLAYATILEGSALRGTLGKRLTGIIVTDQYGRPIGFWTAVKRNIGKVGSVAICGYGFLKIAWSEEKRAWHDDLAGTVVVRASSLNGDQPDDEIDW